MGNSEWLLILMLLIGLAGTIIPMLPGMGLIFLAILVYGYFDGWQNYSLWYVLLVGLLTGVSLLVDYLASAVGAKKFGASKMGFWGALMGGLVGMLVFNVIGFIIGAVLGIVAAELYQRKTIRQSLTAATGVLVGTAAGMAIQLALALLVTIWTVVKVMI